MSIRSVGQFSVYNCKSFCCALSEDTKRKLIALGIDPRTVSSESQAKILIENVVKARKISNVPLPQNICQGEREIMSKAKNLASKMGIAVSDMMKTEEILRLISNKINLAENEEFKSEFASLEQSFNLVKQNENAVYASMNYNASLNIIKLGL
jgi:hypothetical protein